MEGFAREYGMRQAFLQMRWAVYHRQVLPLAAEGLFYCASGGFTMRWAAYHGFISCADKKRTKEAAQGGDRRAKKAGRACVLPLEKPPLPRVESPNAQ